MHSCSYAYNSDIFHAENDVNSYFVISIILTGPMEYFAGCDGVVWDDDGIIIGKGKPKWSRKKSLSTCKIWGFHEVEYKELRLLRCKQPVRTSQKTHYVSATNPNRLMLCNMWGFFGGDYEERRLLGYKNPVHTSRETNYFSATQPSLLNLYNILVFHGGDYVQCRLLGCYAVWIL
jgi:hypothetical protein